MRHKLLNMKRIIIFLFFILPFSTVAFTQIQKDSINSTVLSTKSEIANAYNNRKSLTCYDMTIGFPTIRMTVFKGFKITEKFVFGFGIRAELLGFHTDFLNFPVLLGIKFPTITKNNEFSSFGLTVGGGKVSWSPRNGIQLNNKLINAELIHGWPLKNKKYLTFGFDTELHQYSTLVAPEFSFKFGITY